MKGHLAALPIKLFTRMIQNGIWGVVDSNVNIEGRFNNTVSLNTVSIIHIQSNIQDDSYIVFKADVNLYLIDPSDRYNPVYNNTITKQLRYEFK